MKILRYIHITLMGILFCNTIALAGHWSNFLSPKFTLCKSTYALCTTAACKPIAGEKGKLSCKCDVQTGYSAATKDCEPIKTTKAGDLIQSRFYPVKAYAVCNNNRPWAWCLDVPCLIDKKNPLKSTCTCTVAKNQGPYVIVGNTYNKSTCTTGIISSATVPDIEQITNFINHQKVMPTVTTKVLNNTK